MKCLLCESNSNLFKSEVFLCEHCGLVFKNPVLHYDKDKDLERYSTHKNNLEDKGYIDFLNGLLMPLSKFLPDKFTALDFGCGPGPVLSILLSKLGGDVFNFDLYFFNDQKLLEKKFEVVTCSEVIEHFKNPKVDFDVLIERVENGGLLAIKTLLFNESIDYKSWWYKNDPTHVVFYQQKTIDFLRDKYNLEIVFNDDNSVIIFRKK